MTAHDAEGVYEAPFSLELAALGCDGEPGLGSAQTSRALTRGCRCPQPLSAAFDSAPGMVYGSALARSLSQALNRSVTGSGQCLLAPALAGQLQAALSVRALH